MKEYNKIVEWVKNNGYPDLEHKKEGWKDYLVSSNINAEAEKFEMSTSCGCCPDAGIIIRPYKEIKGLKVYAKGSPIFVGEESKITVDIFDDWWENTLIKNNISKKVIEDFRKYVDENGHTYE